MINTQWTDERIQQELEADNEAMRLYPNAFVVRLPLALSVCKQMRNDMAQEIARLRGELAAVLDVATARGESLGYDSDDDYKARYQQLTGKEWGNE